VKGYVPIVKIRTKREIDRKATPNRILATWFYIRCLELAIGLGKFPRDYSLFKIEMEFQPGNFFGKNLNARRDPLDERLARIMGQIVYGREKKKREVDTRVAVEVWMQKPEIKTMLAEKVLTE